MTNIPPTDPGSSSERFSRSNATDSQAQSNSTFSIATTVVTQINENLNDASFMHPAHVYHQETTIGSQQTSLAIDGPSETMSDPSEPMSRVVDKSVNSHSTTLNQSIITDNCQRQDIGEELSTSATNNFPKKKNKTSKKGLKLDTKSKLEKSRQSARECRARKKLRYQYLEDLVCNREKAVVKLREELTMFCRMSEQIDAGTISETDRSFLVEQTKENNMSAQTVTD